MNSARVNFSFGSVRFGAVVVPSASTPWQAVGLLQWAGAAIMSNAMGRGE